MKNIFKLFLTVLFFSLLISCKEKVEEKPFEFNGNSFYSIINNAIKGDKNSQKILNGFINFTVDPASYNRINVDSIKINSSTYYTLLLENQNPVYNLFAVVDKEINLILKDESLNGYLSLNFKKSGSRIFAVVTENFKSKDIIELNRVSYYIMEEYACDLAFRQFIKLKTTDKEAEQVVSLISDTAIVTNIFIPSSTTSKSRKDIFNFDVANSRYLSINNFFDTLVYKEIKNTNISVINPQLTEETYNRFFNPSFTGLNKTAMRITEEDYAIELDSSWVYSENITYVKFVKQKTVGVKYFNSESGSSIFIAKVDSADSASTYLNEQLKNEASYKSFVKYSDKLIDKENVYQLFEFSCPTNRVILIFEMPKSTYDKNKELYDRIIQNFLVKC